MLRYVMEQRMTDLTMAQNNPRANASLCDNCRTWSMRELYTRLSLRSWTKARTVLMLASRSSATSQHTPTHTHRMN